MKLSKKYEQKVKKRILNTLASIALVTTMLATMKLADFPMPFVNLMSASNLPEISKQSSSSEALATSSATTTVTIAEDGAIVCDSIVQGVRDSDLADGTYTFRVTGKNSTGTQETKDYAVELINYYDDVTYSLASGETSKTISLGDSTTEYKMLVVKYHKNLTINSGVTVTATTVSSLTYKKGMYICVMGELLNKGTISMTARGTYNQAGENVYLWKNADSSFEYVPAIGGAGGIGYGVPNNSGRSGSNGSARSTAGGGSGGACGTDQKQGGNGSAGTSYSGGSGGGGSYNANSASSYTGGHAGANGGAGGYGSVKTENSSNKVYASGGAGNLAGLAAYRTTSGQSYANVANSYAQNGTGGLLIIYSNVLYNSGNIRSNGSNVVGKVYGSANRYAGGGGSGGGSINIFANTVARKGTITATGGTSTVSSGYTYAVTGASGGKGSTTVQELMPDLNYTTKEIVLKLNETYTIDSSDFKYLNPNTTQTPDITLGTIQYEAVNEEVITVDSNGRITGIKEGITKVKITDMTNDVCTYIFVEVVDQVKTDVQEGKNFTVALKQNGTVWTYGLNTSGQLGIGNNTNQTEPTQIDSLNNIKAISTGYSHVLALDKNGDVYSWGAGTNGQLGNGGEKNSSVPVKVDGISNIIKIDAYKNISVALANDGKVYIWGEGYSTLPMKVVFSERVIDISGVLMLTENGYVYNVSNLTTPISGLSNIAKISCGTSHYLALTPQGVVYAWGTNTYGECGTSTTGTISVNAIGKDMREISAGNCMTMMQKENGTIYVLGNNANGQLGLGTTSKATGTTTLSISDVEIETISAGEGTHSSLIATDGFVWNTGLNTYGELGTGNTTAKTAYSQIGSTILTTNFEQKYLEIGESATVTAKIENTFNLKIDIIDENQDNFKVSLSNNESLSLNDKTITALDYCTTTATVSHITETLTKDLKIIVAMKMESIVQGFRDIDLPDGEYSVVINDQSYSVELINYYDDMIYTENTQLGDDSAEYKTLVVKYHKDLTVNSGVTLTAKSVNNLTYKKGMYICVLGNIYNNGTISMTAKGTYNQAGEDVFLWKNINDTFEYVPATGGTGGTGIGGYNNTGNAGKNGTNRATGGGGSGGAMGTNPKQGGNGSSGTSYSGGSGGGGSYHCVETGTYAGGNAGANGGAGGTGAAKTDSSSNKSYASGGAGNLAGAGAYVTSSGNAYGNAGTYAQNGTGGLLTIYADTLYNEGTISSNGSSVIGKRYSSTTRYAGGGASGGGSVNVFANFVNTKGNIEASGGVSTVNASGMKFATAGASGGAGTVTINELGSILNYSTKKIELNVQETYAIDTNKITYTKLNDIQTEDLIVGNLNYESLNTSIATVDSNGKITGLATGKTKIKITDLDNGYYTYIIVNVTKKGLVIPQIEEGIDYTVVLKANGTVWSYGENSNGQLGNNSTVSSNEPIEVLTENLESLKNIVDIGAGYNCGIALSNDGEVYTWGLYKYKDSNGSAQSQNRLVATKEPLLHNIVKVESYKNNFYAIDADGIAYIWGEGYDKPTKIETAVGIEDISGDILLGQDGLVYLVSNPTERLEYLSNICEVSCGEDHYLFLALDGYIYSLGKNDLGQRR